MEKNIAQKIIKQIDIVGAEAGELLELVRQFSDEELKNKYINHIADIFDILAINLTGPIVKKHPDLDPDKEYFEEKRKQKALQQKSD